MHGEAAGRALETAGATLRTGARVDDLAELDAEAVVVAVPPAESARLLGEPEPELDHSPIVSVHLLFDRHLLPQPLAALLDSPAHWVFDRGRLTGHEPERGQYLTVVSSGAPELEALRGRELVELIAGAVTERLGPRGAALVARQPRARGHDRRPPRQRSAPARPGDGEAQRHARGRVDRHGLAADDGGCGPQRPRRRAGAQGGTAGGGGLTIAPERIETRLDGAIDAATARLLELQHADGYWVGELESNATMIAQHLFWHHVLGLRTPELDRKIANELLVRQREDGTWSIWFEGPPDLSTSVEAYAALKLAGVDPGERARDFIRSQGGIAGTRIFTKCFLALLGQWPWQRITPIPVELVLLPPSAPLSIYDFSCWARGTFVPLSACRALRPVRPARIDLREIGARPGQSKPAPRPSALRRAALREAERWVRSHQEADGSWGGIQPPWVWSILMLVALGHGFEDETLRRAVEGWEGFVIDEGGRLRPEACQSPVWDTGLAVLALRDSGLGPEHPALVQAAEWLEHEESHRARRLGGAPPGARAGRLGLRVRKRSLP